MLCQWYKGFRDFRIAQGRKQHFRHQENDFQCRFQCRRRGQGSCRIWGNPRGIGFSGPEGTRDCQGRHDHRQGKRLLRQPGKLRTVQRYSAGRERWGQLLQDPDGSGFQVLHQMGRGNGAQGRGLRRWGIQISCHWQFPGAAAEEENRQGKERRWRLELLQQQIQHLHWQPVPQFRIYHETDCGSLRVSAQFL